MLSRVKTVAFKGLEIVDIEVQVQILSGMPAFTIVGLPDKAVAESRERIRAALFSMGLKLPAKRITINLAPADILKEGTHYDLPLALGLLCGMGLIKQEKLSEYVAVGEVGLDGAIIKVAGVLPAAIRAEKIGGGFICPDVQKGEAAWAEVKNIAPVKTLSEAVDYLNGNEELCTMRTKSLSVNNLTIKSTVAANFWKFFNSFGIAIFVVIAGLIVWRLRNARRHAINKKYNPDDTRTITK